MMKQLPVYILSLGALACAVVWMGRGCARDTRRGPARTASRPPPAVRVFDYERQLDALSTVDPALLLYRETASLVPAGIDTLTAVAVGPDGRIYAGGGRRVVTLSPEGKQIGGFEVDGAVTCLAADEKGSLVVGLGTQVQLYSAAGERQAALGGLRTDAIITAVATAAETVFVADARSRSVLRFTADGALMKTITGVQGEQGDPGFIVPSPYFDLMPGQGGTLWIVNPGRHRLEEYTFDGERIAAWPENTGMAVSAFCGCCNPCHVAQLSDGSVVTSEKGLARVKVYSRRGGFIGVVAEPAQFGTQEASLDLAVDTRDRILVADPLRNQIRVFEKK